MKTRHRLSVPPDGLYWYIGPDMVPEPVLIDRQRFGECFRGFDGRTQDWMGDGERLVGPIEPPAYQAPQIDEVSLLFKR